MPGRPQGRRAREERAITDLLDRLRDRHWRVTPQRRVVAEVLDADDGHLTADAVLSRALERLPEISLATVYNTLNELVAMGELVEVAAGGGPKRYDRNVAPHHHLVCTACGALKDVPARAVEPLSGSDRQGFVVQDVEVVFKGLCPVCAPGGDAAGHLVVLPRPPDR